MPVGPSELCYVADQSTNPVYAAADILAHAEQSTHNQLVVLVNSEEVADKINEEIDKQLEAVSLKKKVAKESLKNAKMIVFKTNVESIALPMVIHPKT